jgi:hypothetical protein
MAAELASTTDTQAIMNTTEREAIIFIPSIGKGWDDPSIEGVARRMATAIDRQSINEKATAHVEVAEQEYGTGFKCKMFTIVKREGQIDQPLIDVYGLDYNDTLVETYVKRNLLMKTILLAVTLIEGFRRLIFRFYRRGKSVTEKIQLAYGLLIAGLLVVYLVILIGAVVASVQQLRRPTTTEPATALAQPTPSPTAQNTPPAEQVQAGLFENIGAGIKSAVTGSWTFIKRQKDRFPAIIVLLTALGFVLPPQAQIKEKVSLAATNYLCLIHYLNWGERSHAIGGKLESLLEHLLEREQGYHRIHVIGYSFGSIVAIDNLFTAGRKPIERFQKIATLVTIGCPFDIIRTYWPSYFTGRQSATTETMKWINVYSPIDILSSNFADVGNAERVDQTQSEGIGVEVDGQIRKPESVSFSQGSYQGLGIIDVLTLTGFRAHSLYWGEDVQGEITCFHDVVKKIYQGTPVLN